MKNWILLVMAPLSLSLSCLSFCALLFSLTLIIKSSSCYNFKEINFMNDKNDIFFLKWQGWDQNTTFRAAFSAYNNLCKQLFQL